MQVVDLLEQQNRARFDVLRRKIFGELGYASARWRLSWILPFHLSVLALLVVRGEAWWRAGIQGGAVMLSAVLFGLQLARPSDKMSLASIFVGTFGFFAAVAVTGGLASPLLICSMLVLVSAAVSLREPRWAKPLYFAFFVSMAVGLALASRSSVGQLATPLSPNNGWSSAEYVTIALMSVVFVAVGTYRMGCTMSTGYERIALELAERREELCSENEDRTRALEGIAARLAHEVKNPLAAIKGLSTHMARSAADPKTAERLSIVAAEADRLQQIVEGFLSFSRGLDDLKVAPTKPYELARELALLLETRAADHGVTLDVAGGADVTLNADGRKLRQALLNLVLNAMQASPKGGIVKVDVLRGGLCGGVKIRVSDQGTGMTADVLDRIRKPYFTTKEGGSGLGVAVARGLIEQHGGQLHYESAPGLGTTVTIDLPVCSMKYAKDVLPSPFRKGEGGLEAAGLDVSTEAAAR
jgi:signal transduction histidine kinase